MPPYDRGLDLGNLAGLTAGELKEFREHYGRVGMARALPAYEFWLDLDPEVLKRHRLQAFHGQSAVGIKYPLACTLAMLHYYATLGFAEGVIYEAESARRMGLGRAVVLDLLALAFLHAGPRGMLLTARPVKPYLDNWVEAPPSDDLFPPHWSVDPTAFNTDLDAREPDLSDAERARVVAWYEGNCGHVPPGVRMLLARRPRLLKSFRLRFEAIVKHDTPKQLVPYVLLHYYTTLGSVHGVREAAGLARGFGMTEDETLDAVAWGLLYGGPAALSVAAEALEM